MSSFDEVLSGLLAKTSEGTMRESTLLFRGVCVCARVCMEPGLTHPWSSVDRKLDLGLGT